jgi:hypothetical protein
LSTQRNFDNNLSVGLQFAYYRASDSANNLGGATDVYAWRMARLYVTIPY